ncbi:MAG: hypothetical protein HUU55_07170 [Myxococcales bacterium]|nr:hypothetical protein [Myxococcales bacterium]
MGRKSTKLTTLGLTLLTTGLLGAMISGIGPTAQASCPTLVGDLNDDGTLNVVDVQCDILVVLYDLNEPGSSILPPCLTPANVIYADINCDGSVAVTDVVLLITLVLGMPLDKAIDANGDGCADICEAALAPVLDGLPTSFTGTSSGGDFVLRPLGAGPPAAQSSSGNDYQLSPRLWGKPIQ